MRAIAQLASSSRRPLAFLSTCFTLPPPPGYRPSVSRNNGFRILRLSRSSSFPGSTDHLSSRQPNRRRLVLRATVTERASTRKPKRSLSSDGIHKGREPFLRDTPLIRIRYRTPRDNHRSKFSSKLVPGKKLRPRQ